MFLKRLISFVLILQIISLGFVAFCPDNHEKGLDIHLITESCEDHEFDHSIESHAACSRDVCEHGTCNDMSVTEFSRLPELLQILFITPIIYAYHVILESQKITSTIFLYKPSQGTSKPLTLVLRI